MSELAEALRRRLGAEITGLRRLSGGASRETWAFEARPGGRLVLRRDPPGEGRPEEMALEAALIRAAGEAGVPVPRLVDHSTDTGVLGSPYLITSHVDGETIPRRLLRDPEFAGVRPGLAAELGRVAARIHAMPLVPGLSEVDPLDAVVRMYDALGQPLPSLEIGLHWLRAHRPGPSGDTVVHGDFRTGNLIVAPGGLAAVLDWELAHRGDPLEDLGWLCVKAWRFGSPLPAGGFGSRDELLDGYAEVAGFRPDPAALHWWEVFGTVRWGVMCLHQAERHLSGRTRSVELAAIGRRVCEQEHDLLCALGVPGGAGDAVAAATPDLHGRPSAVDLVEAVAEFLRTEVMPGTEGRLSFQARVAANVLGVVERELRLGAAQEARHGERLAALGFRSHAELAAALRTGRLDPFDETVLNAVREDVTDRLLVANPRYLDGG
ncbi:phosphotransferase family protein [Amycolatopsis thermophila]|uniref:Aminoglycoside phosphotransferase (APT) family kinase protein n=1 Tax=Amycolatopsis thermophila TaxID=206084 RepID=A0ABU0ELN9_9PSEU|nr:phosphotransferase family protein [Amycolatopsis thermophila]MDQ0376205.1 aminoglycoside phosphotransferase (APT) family kinase protein [Amycolatopsis thermophila]